MAKTLSTGLIVAIAHTYGADETFTAISNAAEAVASFVGSSGFTEGDYVEITSGWGRLNGRIARVKTLSGSGPYLVTLESIDTTDTTKYPAGTGAGSMRKIATWQNLSQIKEQSVSGGDQQFADVTDIEDVVEKKIPTIRSAVALSMTVFDDPSLAWYAVVQAAADASTPQALKLAFANGSKLVANAYWSLQNTPNIAKNEAMTAKIDVSYAATPTRYAT